MQRSLTDQKWAFKGKEWRRLAGWIALCLVLVIAASFDREERRFNPESREHCIFPSLDYMLVLIEGVGVQDALSMHLDY